MAENPKDERIDIEPLSDDALEDVAGGQAVGSSGQCCSCDSCSNPPPPPV
jgi:hypothetical protein